MRIKFYICIKDVYQTSVIKVRQIKWLDMKPVDEVC